MGFTRSDYSANPHAGASRNDAAARGWGPGWPSNNAHKMGLAEAGGVKLWVRKEVVPLVEVLLACTVERGYDLKGVKDDWGYANRPIHGTRVPSNHSWGLAVDLNSTENPMSTKFVSDIPPAVVADWEACGFYWGGRYENRPDAMHFEYLGRPRDVARHLAEAKAILAKLREPKVSTPKPITKQSEAKVIGKHDLGDRTLKLGAKGNDVAFIQRFIDSDLKDDGVFGPKTEAAVKAYQKMRGLKVDGIVGPKTWGEML